MVHVRGAWAGASGILPSRGCGRLITIGGRFDRTIPAIVMPVALLIEKATLGARQDAPFENSRLSIVS